MKKENMTTELRLYISERLDEFYEAYENEHLSDEEFNTLTALIRQFEAIANVSGGINFKKRQIDRELGNIKRA